uniref:Uncharacterized protein n=2 Tax=Nothobranchius TaxID=28779 RepID=A0A1A8UL39_NOTFU
MHPVKPVALPGPREPEPRSRPEASLGLTIWPCSFKLSGRTLHLLNRCLVLFSTTGSIGFMLLYQVLKRGTIALDVKRWASMGSEMVDTDETTHDTWRRKAAVHQQHRTLHD